MTKPYAVGEELNENGERKMYNPFNIKNGSLKKYIGRDAHVIVPEGVARIKQDAFKGCPKMTTVTIPDSVITIESWAFDRCSNLTAVMIPESVSKISGDAFFECSKITIVCHEGSYAHRYAVKNHITYLFDYQYEAFHGVIPPGTEILSSPFLADEEQPYVFISYSHKDRDIVLKTIKELYEAGWKIWYDEGLTIGDQYDETLEKHVRDCSAFLLFVTENSLNSLYIRENEVPWSITYGKPIIRCMAKEDLAYEIEGNVVADTVYLNEIENALQRIDGLTKGEPRKAKGISVAVDPAARKVAGGNGFAYCIYAKERESIVKAILLEVQNSGCNIYNAVEEGENEEKLKGSFNLTVFLDKAFLDDRHLKELLIEAYRSQKDIAVCLLEEIEDRDLPEELLGLHLMQWLNFSYGLNRDMITKFVRHMQKIGCRNISVLPDFDYKKTKNGIVINRYTGKSPEPFIEKEYGGIPVREIGERCFENCIHLTAISVPEHVTKIGKNAFSGCTDLHEVRLPDALTIIGDYAFENCRELSSVRIPDTVTAIGESTFFNCLGLETVTIPSGVKRIEKSSFKFCQRLHTVQISEGVTEIGSSAFSYCTALSSLMIPDSVKIIGDDAFSNTNISSIILKESVEKIGSGAFSHCSKLETVILPEGIKTIEKEAFCCTGLTVINVPDSVTKIEDRAFLSCEKLVSVKIPGNVKTIPYEAFRYCISLCSVTIPDSVTIIESGAFKGCRKLTSIRIPDSVREIEYDAFADCPNLTVICSPDSFSREYCQENGICFN